MALSEHIHSALTAISEAKTHAEQLDLAYANIGKKCAEQNEEILILREQNVLIRARLGESSDDLGGAVSRGLRAAAVVVFSDHRGVHFNNHRREAALWLKSCGWGEGGNNTFVDPHSRDSYLIANAIDIQSKRDLEKFRDLMKAE